MLTKISPPHLPAVFNRTRLFELLDRCCQQPVVWIPGEPGSGKTTLAASYLESRNIPAIWYQMDKVDSNPANFFYYMTLAAGKAACCRKSTLPGLSSEHYSNLPEYAVQYFRELFSGLRKQSVIVLDNYQEVDAGSELHDLVKIGLEQVPPDLNIIILSRTEPPPAMARLLLNRYLAVMQTGELLLTSEECRGIAELHDKWKSALDCLPAIEERTGGWTAGFVVMLEYSNPGEQQEVTTGELAGEFFFNYFAGEIFNKLEPAVRDFLRKAALFPSFTPDAAEELTGFADAGQVLAEMNRKNYFTERKDQDGINSYQFHPLFREFLLSRTEKEEDPGQLNAVYRKAADILAGNGRLEDAYYLYARSGDRDAQADMIRTHAQTLMTQRRTQVVAQWLRELPPEMLDSDPWLLYWLGQCRLPFNPGESRALFIRAHDHFTRLGDSTGLLLSLIGTLETILTEWGNFRQMDPWIEELDRLMRNAMPPPAGEIEARAIVTMFSALMFRQPGHREMGYWENRAQEVFRSDTDNKLRLVAGSNLAHYYYWTGDIIQAGRIVDIMNELMKTVDHLSPLDFMVVKMQEAVHRWFIADFPGCLLAVEQGLAEADRTGVHLVDNWLLAQGVYAMLSLADLVKAKTLLARMQPILNTRRHLDISHFYFLSSIYHLQKENMEQALQYIEQSLQIAREVGTPFPEGLNAITAAQIYFARGEGNKAKELTALARDIGRNMNSHLLHMLSHLNEAYFLLHKGRRKSARQSLSKALAIRREKGIINFPSWRTGFMTALYSESLESGIEADFVREIIRRRNILPDMSSAASDDWPWPIRIYTLGGFAMIIDGEPLRFTGKPPLKPLELLQALIALGGRGIRLDRLEDLLWPEADGDRSRQALVTTLHRLRKLIGNSKALKLSEMKLSLHEGYCWLDVWAFDSLCKTISEAVADDEQDPAESSRLTARMLSIYRGKFLENEHDHSWALPARQRFRSSFLLAVGSLARLLEKQGDHGTAADLYQRGLAVHETAEELYQGLMRCYLAQGRTADGLKVYERCREVLSSALQVTPSESTESIRLFLQRERPAG